MDPSRLPVKRINRHLRAAAREVPGHGCYYGDSKGLAALRRQISRHAVSFGCSFPPEEIVITLGAMEALSLSLRSVAAPGDVVAVESPSYFGILQALEAMGLRALELPTDPQTGPNLDFLEGIVRRHRVKAVMTMTNCHNPLGYVLADAAKRDLVALATRYDVAVIEDDVFGELAFADRRPKPAKAFDRAGQVLLCSSFSKTVGPGLRVGWVHAGRFASRVELLKSVTTVSTPALTQLALAQFLESGGYFRHVRRVRWWLQEQVKAYSATIAETFPPGTRVSRPAGGHLLWVQLPEGTDGDRLHARAIDAGISIVPGSIFSPTRRYTNYLRLNCGHAFSPAIARAIRTLGRLAAKAR